MPACRRGSVPPAGPPPGCGGPATSASRTSRPPGRINHWSIVWRRTRCGAAHWTAGEGAGRAAADGEDAVGLVRAARPGLPRPRRATPAFRRAVRGSLKEARARFQDRGLACGVADPGRPGALEPANAPFPGLRLARPLFGAVAPERRPSGAARRARGLRRASRPPPTPPRPPTPHGGAHMMQHLMTKGYDGMVMLQLVMERRVLLLVVVIVVVVVVVRGAWHTSGQARKGPRGDDQAGRDRTARARQRPRQRRRQRPPGRGTAGPPSTPSRWPGPGGVAAWR